MYAGFASMLLGVFAVVSAIADQISAGQAIIILAGVGGGGILGLVFKSFMGTYNSSQAWKDAQLQRQDDEIKRLSEDNKECQASCDKYREEAFKTGMEAFRVHREIGALIQVTDQETADKLRAILLGSQSNGSK